MTPEQENIIADASEKELVFSPKHVRQIEKTLGPVELMEDARTHIVRFGNLGALQFGGDRGGSPDYMQRTHVDYYSRGDRRYPSSFNIHLQNISRIERVEDNPHALRFIGEMENMTVSLTVDNTGKPALMTL